MNAEHQTDDWHIAWRLGAFIALVAVSGPALPLSAFVVEAVSPRAENWIIVVYLVVMALLGGAMGAGIRKLRAPSTSRRAAVLAWGGVGLLAAAVGGVIWFVLISG